MEIAVVAICLGFVAWREYEHTCQVNELLSRIYMIQSLPPVRTPLDQAEDLLRKHPEPNDNERSRPGMRVREVRSFKIG